MNKVLNLIDKIAHIFLSLGIIIILFVSSIDFHCFNYSFFEKEYAKLKTAESLEMSQDDLMKATTTLLDYLQNQRDDIDVEINVQGNQVMAFNEKEAIHMIDVRNLYQSALLVRSIAMITSIISIIYLWFRQHKTMFLHFSTTFIKVAIVFGFGLGMLAVWAIADFNSFWTSFHEVLFTNDLWLLDPRVDLMINLFPSAFFFSLVMKIVVSFVVIFATIIIACFIYLKRIFKKGTTYETNLSE